MVSDQELIELLETCEERVDRPVTNASEIAETVGIARQNVHRRLQRLHEDDVVRKYKPGPAAVWWVEGVTADA